MSGADAVAVGPLSVVDLTQSRRAFGVLRHSVLSYGPCNVQSERFELFHV